MDAGALDAVLPPGVLPQHGPPCREADDYGDGFVLPVHGTYALQLLNTHPLDARLCFYELPHVYTFDGVPTSASVTKLAHEFEEEFDPEAAIRMMRDSRTQAWPRLEYVVNAAPLTEAAWTGVQGALRCAGGKTVAVVHPHSMTARSSLSDVRELLRIVTLPAKGGVEAEEAEDHVFERELTADEIRAKWKANGTRASHLGTERHHLAECFFNGMPFRWWEPDMRVLFEFCHTHLLPRGIVAFNTEKEIVCADADVAGSIDLILYDPATKTHHLVDFKRSDKLESQLRGYRKMGPPFTHLDDCKGAGYALQLSIYQYILEREYGMTMGDRVLLSLHADKPFVTSVPYLKAETEYIMAQRFRLVRARRAAAVADPACRCALAPAAPLVDAVRLPDGRYAMEKMAQVRDVPYTVAAEQRAHVDKAVAAHLEAAPVFDATACTSWRKQMPLRGIAPTF